MAPCAGLEGYGVVVNAIVVDVVVVVVVAEEAKGIFFKERRSLAEIGKKFNFKFR